jgi:hypothetical protein
MSLERTRVALVVYSGSNIKILSYLNEKKSRNYFLSLINWVKLEKNLNSNLTLVLEQCDNVFKVENGMRDFKEGVAKQIILISGEDMSKNSDAVQAYKKLRSKGLF